MSLLAVWVRKRWRPGREVPRQGAISLLGLGGMRNLAHASGGVQSIRVRLGVIVSVSPGPGRLEVGDALVAAGWLKSGVGGQKKKH